MLPSLKEEHNEFYLCSLGLCVKISTWVSTIFNTAFNCRTSSYLALKTKV